MEPYPDIEDPDFHERLLSKVEFQRLAGPERVGFHGPDEETVAMLEPQQQFAQTYLGPGTPYEALLLFHETGTGKTGAAIAVAQVNAYAGTVTRDNRVLVLAKNQTVLRNFRQEIMKGVFVPGSGCDADRRVFGTFLSEAQKTTMVEAVAQGDVDTQRRLLAAFRRALYDVYEFRTFETFLAEARQRPIDLSHRLVIVDEAHNLARVPEQYRVFVEVLRRSARVRVLLLTATPAFDSVRELFPLLNLLLPAAWETPLPVDGPGLAAMLRMVPALEYVLGRRIAGAGTTTPGLGLRIPEVRPSAYPAIIEAVRGRVSYVRAVHTSFPRRIDHGEPLVHDRAGSVRVVRCQMTKFQAAAVAAIRPRGGASGSEDDAMYKGLSDATTFVYADGTHGPAGFRTHVTGDTTWRKHFRDPEAARGRNLRRSSAKLAALVENLARSPGPAFVYSNYVRGAGIELVAAVLAANGLTGSKTPGPDRFAVLEGSVSAEEAARILAIFNSPANAHGQRFKVLLGSPALSEAVTLRNVRQIHVIEPPWNMSRLRQVFGRGIRHRSHDDLPPEDRTVEVFLYAASAVANVPVADLDEATFLAEVVPRWTIDELKYAVCEAKDRAIKRVERLLKEHAVDCAVHARRNNATPDPDCAYDDDGTCPRRIRCASGPMPKPADPDVSTLYTNAMLPATRADVKCAIVHAFTSVAPVWTLADLTAYVQSRYRIATYTTAVTLGELIARQETIYDRFTRPCTIVPYEGGAYVLQPRALARVSALQDVTMAGTAEARAYLPEELHELPRPRPEAAAAGRKRKRSSAVERETTHVVDMTDHPIAQANDIYGTFFDRFGVVTQQFRLVDKNYRGRGVQRYGQVCATIHQDQLLETAQRLGLAVHGRPTRAALCQSIEAELRRRGAIITDRN